MLEDDFLGSIRDVNVCNVWVSLVMLLGVLLFVIVLARFLVRFFVVFVLEMEDIWDFWFIEKVPDSFFLEISCVLMVFEDMKVGFWSF